MQVNHIDLLNDLKSGRPIRIKVFNLGENLGMDLAYFDHYHALKHYFPNVEIHLYRSNVDETNCIGLENWRGKVELPVDNLEMAVVRQRYPDGQDWAQKLNNHQWDIFTPDFRNIEGFDYIWGIGYGSAPCWQAQYPEETKFIQASTVQALFTAVPEVVEKSRSMSEVYAGINSQDIKPWERTALEYALPDSLIETQYPFVFTPEFRYYLSADQFKNCIRVGLRWPDHVRWYYSIERQFEFVHEVITKLRNSGSPVNMVFTLKDGEVGNNFNRGQTLQHLRRLQDACDQSLFTYSWTANPYQHRLSEQQELARLRDAGIKNVQKVDVWEDLLISSACKVYLSDPGGFAEVICNLRDPESTILFPTSFNHSATYVSLNQDKVPVKLKINRVSANQFYRCDPVLSAVDDPEGYRTLHWNMQYLDDKRKIGDNNHGDDWQHFENAQANVFKDWYYATKDALGDAVVKEMLK